MQKEINTILERIISKTTWAFISIPAYFFVTLCVTIFNPQVGIGMGIVGIGVILMYFLYCYIKSLEIALISFKAAEQLEDNSKLEAWREKMSPEEDKKERRS
jgi:hypothetical protein